MDEYSSRRNDGGFVISRKGSSLIPRDSTENNRDHDVQVSSRVGCSSSSSRLNPTKSTQIGSPSKSKASKVPFHSSSQGKDIVGSSSRKSVSDQKKKSHSYKLETDSETDSSVFDESESVSNTSGKAHMKVHPEPHDDYEVVDVGASGPSNKLVSKTVQKFGWACQDNSQASSSSSFARSNSYAIRYSLRNSRIGEPESISSSSKVNNILNSNRGISISDNSRITRNLNSSGDNDDATSVRARRANARRLLISQGNRNFALPMIESPLLTLPSPQPENISVDASGLSGSSENPRTNRLGLGSPYEAGLARSFMNRDTLRQFNLDGIAEMLLALERIGQEEEPSYEQLVVLETNLLMGGLSFHDQHREMRLDIDNMSYEELLALEERMGSVSTAIPEEALTKCLETEICMVSTDCTRNEDAIRCCICQEEYVDGEEIGRLGCDHRYHRDCIHQWLSHKNWCPICKSSAAVAASN